MKKATPVLFSFLLTVALVFCLPLVAFRAEGISEAEGERYVSYIPLEVYRGCSDLSQFPDGFQCAVAEPLFSELFRLKLLPEDYRSVTFDSTPSPEELASFPKVSLADVAAVVDSMYGVGASALLTPSQGFSACKKMHLIYLEETKEFAFYVLDVSPELSPERYSYAAYLRSETDGENLILYSVYAEYGYGNLASGNKAFQIYDLSESYNSSVCKILFQLEIKKDTKEQEKTLWVSRLKNGKADPYLPVYKHTFKPNGDGTYSWVNTSLDTVALSVPVSVFTAQKEEVVPQTLLKGVPTLAYTGKTEYASSDAYFDDVLFYYLRKAGFPSVTPRSEEPSAEDLAAPHYSAVYVAAMAKRIFGDEAAEKLKSRSQIRSGTDALYLSDDGTYYSYVSFTAPAYETVPSHSVEYVTSEKIENGYTVDVRYFRRAGYETSDFWISGVCEGEGATLYSRTEAASEEPTGWVILAAVKAYAKDCLPVYRHTFLSDGAGGYLWHSTELVKEGTEIPMAEIVERYIAANSFPIASDTQVSDTSTDSDNIADSVTDTPSTDIPTTERFPLFDEAAEESYLVWACIGGLAVIAAFVPFLLWKKKT